MQCSTTTALNQRAVLNSTKGEAATRSRLRPSSPTHLLFPHDCVLQLGQSLSLRDKLSHSFFPSLPLFSSSYKEISVHIPLGCKKRRQQRRPQDQPQPQPQLQLPPQQRQADRRSK